MYTVVNETYPYGRNNDLPDRGLSNSGDCKLFCFFDMTVNPTDMRYDGA